MRNGVQIGQDSERTGLSTDAIRFYEKQRLLERASRTEGGFRLFGREDIQRIRFDSFGAFSNWAFLFQKFGNYWSSIVITPRRVLMSATSCSGSSARCAGRSGSFAH